MTAMKIGLFGGTFNPIHFGHLRAALEVQEGFGLAKVFLIPAAVPPHKAQAGVDVTEMALKATITERKKKTRKAKKAIAARAQAAEAEAAAKAAEAAAGEPKAEG